MNHFWYKLSEVRWAGQWHLSDYPIMVMAPSKEKAIIAMDREINGLPLEYLKPVNFVDPPNGPFDDVFVLLQDAKKEYFKIKEGECEPLLVPL